MLKVFIIISALLIGGCGYRPLSHNVQNVIGDRVYVEIETFQQDPENSVLIKDALNEAFEIRTKVRPVKKIYADTSLYLKLDKLTFTPLRYDKNGYVIFYRTTISMSAVLSNSSETFDIYGHFDFPVEPNAIITDSLRFEAIKQASLKAIDMLMSKISISKSVRG